MAKLMVFLADLPGTVAWPSPIRTTVEELFEQVVRASSDISKVKVEWCSKVPPLGAHDLLVYFVASRSDSVVKKGLSKSITLGDTGTTAIGGKIAASEVYLAGNQDDPKGLGKVAFHELMHNICLITNSLHGMKNLSMGKEEVTARTELSREDIDLLVKNLTKKRVQWTDGYKFKAKKFASGDPAADLF